MSWNEPGNSSGNRNPWGQRPGQGPPDLDEALRNLQRKLASLFGGGKGGGGNGTARSASGGWNIVVAGLVLLWLATGLYKVDTAERGIVTRFGKYVATTESGLRWHMPWPIEAKQLVNIEAFESFNDRTSMLTVDENLVDIDVTVQYRRSDPVAYAFNVRSPELTLNEVSESAIRELIGRSSLEAVLASGRVEITTKIKDLIQRTLDSYKTGIEVTNINLQAVNVPVQVTPAQEDAIKSREDKERLPLEAQTYANDILPKAKGTATRLLQDAMAYRAQKIANAEGESQRFLKLLSEYERAPGVTRERLYLETMESVLTRSKKILIDAKGGNNMIYLPLDKLLERQAVRDEVISSRPVMMESNPQVETQRARGSR